MQFAAPWFLLTLAALPVVALLHVLRVPGRRSEVADLRLWQNVLERVRPEAAERLKRFDKLLLLELAVVTLLGLALAQPVIPLERPRRHIGFILDLSASMNTVENDRTRWKEALSRIDRIVGRLSNTDRISFVAGPPFRYSGMALSREEFLYEVGEPDNPNPRMEPADIPVVPERLLETGLTALGEDHEAIFLVTDNPPKPPLDKRVRLALVGAASRNVGITAFAVASAPNGGYEAFARVQNFSDAPAERILNIGSRRDNTTVSLSLASLEMIEKVVPVHPTPDDPLVHARLDDRRDGLVADDRVAAVLPTLTVVAQGENPDPAYARLFGGKVFENTVYAEIGAEVKPALPPDALLIAQGCIPSRLASTTVVIDPSPGDVAGIAVGEVKTLATSRSPLAASNDPLLAEVNLDELKLDRCRRLHLPGSARPLIRIDADVIAAEVSLAGGHVVVLGFDPAAARWTLKPSFVVFWTNLMREVSGRLGECVFHRTGETLDMPTGSLGDVWWDIYLSPDFNVVSQEFPAPAIDGWSRIKTHEVAIGRWPKKDSNNYVAVNLLSEIESDNRPPDFTRDNVDEPLPAVEAEAVIPLGGWFALAAALLAGTWWMVRR